MINFIKRQSPVRIIAFGFLVAILLGAGLLIMPISVKQGVTLRYIDALYTSTSAVCVTGLIAVDAGDTFTTFGKVILGLLIQIGGLGVTSIGAGIILAVGKRMNLKGMSLVKEAMNLDSGKGIKKIVKDIFITTIIIEGIGMIFSFLVFIKDYPFLEALGISAFHSVAAFNNSGFDILGNYQGLIPYQNDILLNLVTSALIILGGIGFLVIKDLMNNKFKWKKLSMHTKIVLTMSIVLLVVGTLLIKLTENITWLGAFFCSVSTRTAGFSTFPLGLFSKAGLIVVMLLMFIGASPGSTGGGIKTTTFFALIQGIKASATNKSEKAFKYGMPKDAYRKASVITLLAISIIIVGSYLISIMEVNVNFLDILFEMTSAFGTVGLSTGITPSLSIGSKLVSILIMYIGRLGPLTIASLWYFSRQEGFTYPVGNISIG